MCLGLAVGTVGCTRTQSASHPPRQTGQAPTTPTASPTPASPSSPVASPHRSAGARHPSHARLPRAVPWLPGPSEFQPHAKLHAVRLIETLGSWTGGGGSNAAAERVAALGEDRRLVGQAAPLLGREEQAVVRVIDAQYGGILPGAASVLVVCRQWRTGGRSVIEGGTTVDVRLSQSGGHWHVTALHPAHPGRPDPRPTSLATAVLTSDRIHLPPASAADVKSGRVHDSALTALLHLSRRYRIDVSVIRSGHPIYVFGTSRRSDHPRGRAFDTWRIDGHPVVDPATPRQLIIDYMHDAAAAGSYNVGGPYLLAGSGNQYFSDATHHDHVHAGFLA